VLKGDAGRKFCVKAGTSEHRVRPESSDEGILLNAFPTRTVADRDPRIPDRTCVALFYYTNLVELLQSRGFLAASQGGFPGTHPRFTIAYVPPHTVLPLTTWCVCVCVRQSLSVCLLVLFWFFFVCLFVCCYTTRKSLLRLPPLARVSSCFVS